MLELRDYQKEAIQKTYDFWTNKKGINPVIVCPTGSGKSLIIAKMCEDVCTYDDYSRVLILTHSKELISQNYQELIGIWSDAPAGIYSASLNKRDLKSRIIFASVQSLVNRVNESDPFDLIIIDEAHMVNQKDETRYKKVFDVLSEKNKNVKIIGLSATPYRQFGGFIYGKNKIFCDISFEVDIKFLIDNGYLVKPITKGALKQIDTSTLTIKKNGEYDDIELAEIVNKEELIGAVVSETIEYGKDRKAWIVFATSIEHAEKLQQEFLNKDINTKVITGSTKKDERDSILNDFKNGLIKCLVGINVLTTGFNAPICDLVVIARATRSTSLYVQMIGRGLRLYPDKKDCLILDFGQNTITHGTLDNIVPVIAGNGKKSEKPIQAKECKKCQTLNHIRVSKCVECGNEFPKEERELNHNSKAYDGAMFSDDIKPFEMFVDDVYYYKHISKNGNECLKITYLSGLTVINEFIVINSFFGKKTLNEMNCYFDNIDDILKLENRTDFLEPIKLKVKKEGKYMKIENKIFDDYKDLSKRNCNNCINLVDKQLENSFKKIKYCEVFKTEIKKEWLNVVQEPECPSLDFCPF